MKRLMLLAALCTLCLAKTMAQKETKKFSFGIGIEGGVPTGPISDVYKLGVGLSIRFSYHVGPGFVTLTGSGIGYDPKKIAGEPEKVGLQIPVRTGYKFIVHHFFAMGEVGYAEFKSYYGSNGEVLSTSQGSFIAVPAVGVQFNAFEAALRYIADFRTGGGGLFGVRLGFNF